MPASEVLVMEPGQVMAGSSLSVTVTVKLQLAVLPEASVTRKVLVVTPTGKVEPLESPAVWVTVWPEQLSEEVTV